MDNVVERMAYWKVNTIAILFCFNFRLEQSEKNIFQLNLNNRTAKKVTKIMEPIKRVTNLPLSNQQSNTSETRRSWPLPCCEGIVMSSTLEKKRNKKVIIIVTKNLCNLKAKIWRSMGKTGGIRITYCSRCRSVIFLPESFSNCSIEPMQTT